MRQSISILLLISLLLQQFSRELLVLDYRINQASYLRVCENKARPWLQCYGSCRLKRKMANATDTEGRQQKPPVREEIPLHSTNSFLAICRSPQVPLGKHPLPKHQYFLSLIDPGEIFHPPQIS